MMPRTRILVLAVCLVGFVASAAAQVWTFDTRPAYSGSVFMFNGGTYGETFTDVFAVKSMTYNFFAGGGSPDAVTLSAMFGQWNSGSFVGGTTVSFGTIVVPASNSGNWTTMTNGNGTFATYTYEFDLTAIASPLISATYGYLTNPSNTYALMLTDLTGGTNLGLGFTNSDAFQFGATNFGFNDWTLSQILVSADIPESGSMSAIAAFVLVGSLVALRIYQRRATARAAT